MKNKYIAFIEQNKTTGSTINIILDALTRSDFSELNDENIFDEDYLASIETNLFDISLSQEQYIKLNFNYEEGSWVEFSTSMSKTEVVANLHHGIFFDDNFEKIYIEDVKPISIKSKLKLYSMNIFPETNIYRIFTIIRKINPANVQCYNVGQGNCNSICDSNGEPLVYFDFGAGVYGNSKTYPLNREILDAFSFRENPLVILSHWDWDHMGSAQKTIHSKVKDLLWLVPKQEVGITHLKFAIELYNKGNLLLWPDEISNIKSKYIEIQKINTNRKKDRNNNGLIVIVKIPVEESNTQFNILLPADASYLNICLCRYKELNGLVATHHGATSHKCLIDIPKASYDNLLAYSYGEDNTFDHPKDLSKDAHKKQGWYNSAKTIDGDILISPKPMKIEDIIENMDQ